MSKILLIFFLGFLSFEIFCQTNLIVEVDGEKYSAKQKIILKAGSYEILFHFPENPNYSYRFQLENFENQYKTTPFPTIRYTNIKGGNYVFHGKIIENEEILKEFKSVIEIKENFWEKWWFWLFVVVFAFLAVGLVVYFWFLYDFRQRMKTEQIRQRIAADLHDEVGANLSSITFLVESLKRKSNGNFIGESANSTVLLEKISNNSIESATLINDTIWALNPAFDTFEKLLERTKSFASSLLSANDIAFSVENNLPNSDFELSIEQRRNLYLIMKEAINNIAKHASANKVFLKINQSENGIKISIEDNGIGFDTNEIYEGNGLQNYQLRAKENEIVVKIDSKIDVGTNIEIILSTKNH